MSNNTRIFYACQAVAIEPLKTLPNGTNPVQSIPGFDNVLHGVQSVGVNTSFNLEQIFELGQIQIYENIEGLPEIEITLEKVLDGYPLIYHTATAGVQTSVPTPVNRGELVARSKERCDVYLGIFDESYNSIKDNPGAPVSEVQCTGMYLSSLSYTLPVDGNCTESVTLVGNHKAWGTSRFSTWKNQLDVLSVPGNLDFPKNNQVGTYYGGVQRKENVLIKSSKLPKSIPGVGATPNLNTCHIQNITISTDLGREDILELGSRVPYARPANYPVEVTCEIETISTEGDLVKALPNGDPLLLNTANAGSNTIAEEIVIFLNDGTVFDLGTSNRLSSVNYTGGDAGGGNVTTTFSYTTYNELRVITKTDRDPGGATGRAGATPIVSNEQP